MRYIYPCVLHAEEGGGYWVSFPDVKGANTGGSTREEALEMADDALVAALGSILLSWRGHPVAESRRRRTGARPAPAHRGREGGPQRRNARPGRDEGSAGRAAGRQRGRRTEALQSRPSLPHQHRRKGTPCGRSWADNRGCALASAAFHHDISGSRQRTRRIAPVQS